MAFLTNSCARLLLVALVGIETAGAVRAQGVDEYQVKAAYLYNFAKFVEWPAGAFSASSDPITFCVVGQNPFGRFLTEALNGKTIDSRPLALREFSDPAQAANCHIVFISSSERKRLPKLLDQVQGRAVLTVGECDDFTAQGGVARFVLEGGKVRLEFNLDAAGDARLKISSKLLGLAKVVGRNPR